MTLEKGPMKKLSIQSLTLQWMEGSNVTAGNHAQYIGGWLVLTLIGLLEI